jgi:hypothetical protein
MWCNKSSREGLQWKAFLRNEKSLERKARQPETEAKANAEARVTGGTPKQGTGEMRITLPHSHSRCFYYWYCLANCELQLILLPILPRPNHWFTFKLKPISV